MARHGTPRHATPRHAMPRHATPCTDATPRRATPRRATTPRRPRTYATHATNATPRATRAATHDRTHATHARHARTPCTHARHAAHPTMPRHSRNVLPRPRPQLRTDATTHAPTRDDPSTPRGTIRCLDLRHSVPKNCLDFLRKFLEPLLLRACRARATPAWWCRPQCVQCTRTASTQHYWRHPVVTGPVAVSH